MFQIVYMLIWTIYEIVTMTFEVAIGIILAALAVLLTALAIMIGVAAIWGWGGMKEAAAKAASDRVEQKLREYPERVDEIDGKS